VIGLLSPHHKVHTFRYGARRLRDHRPGPFKDRERSCCFGTGDTAVGSVAAQAQLGPRHLSAGHSAPGGSI
jgi:hypothetical protein